MIESFGPLYIPGLKETVPENLVVKLKLGVIPFVPFLADRQWLNSVLKHKSPEGAMVDNEYVFDMGDGTVILTMQVFFSSVLNRVSFRSSL